MSDSKSGPQLLDAIYRRRSVRAYTEQLPTRSLIDELLDAAIQAPTAMHQEPWAFVVIQDKARLKHYSDQAKAMLREGELAVGWGSTLRARAGRFEMLAEAAFNVFYDASTLVVVCRTIDGPFAEADCWLAAQNLMLAATSKGLGCCCIGLAVPLLNRPDIKRELGIPDEGAAVAPVILGYARGPLPASSRRAPRVLTSRV